jgi:signal transduction histidine kinase/CheY-like chemotaxis protein
MIADLLLFGFVAAWALAFSVVLTIDLIRLNRMSLGDRTVGSQPLLEVSRRIGERFRRWSTVYGVEEERAAYRERLSEEFRRCIRVGAEGLSPYTPLVKILSRELSGLPCAIIDGPKGEERPVASQNLSPFELERLLVDLQSASGSIGLATEIEEIGPIRVPGKAVINYQLLTRISSPEAIAPIYLWIGLRDRSRTGSPISSLCVMLAEWCSGEVKLLHDHLAALRERAHMHRKFDSSRAELVAIAHDLQSPIMTIRAALQMLDRQENDGDQQEFLRIASSALENLRAISKSFLPESSHGGSQICVATIAADLVGELKVTVRSGVMIASDLPDHAPVAVPSVVVRRILENVLSNAVKFTEKGRIDVIVVARAGRVDVTVQDSGIGMSAEQVSALFQPGTRFSKIADGHGIGLFGTRQLAESVGAVIDVDSEFGRGTVVRVSFPSSRHGQVVPETVGVKRPPLSGILIVDDDRECAASLGRLLRSCGSAVVLTSSVTEAFEIVRRGECGTVLFDLGILQGGGGSFVRDVLAIDPRVRLAAISGMFRDTDQYVLAAAGVTECFLKPVEPDELMRWIGQLGNSAQVSLS